MGKVALRLQCAIERQEEPDLTFKIGVHSGRVAAGVVGITLYIIVSLLCTRYLNSRL